MEIQNAKITSTSLGDTGRGNSFWLHLDYGGSGQGFGGYALGGKFTHYVITGILETVGVDTWEELKGKSVRVKIKSDGGWGGSIIAIGHFLDEKWFSPSDFNKECDHCIVSDGSRSSHCKHCGEEL